MKTYVAQSNVQRTIGKCKQTRPTFLVPRTNAEY